MVQSFVGAEVLVNGDPGPGNISLLAWRVDV